MGDHVLYVHAPSASACLLCMQKEAFPFGSSFRTSINNAGFQYDSPYAASDHQHGTSTVRASFLASVYNAIFWSQFDPNDLLAMRWANGAAHLQSEKLRLDSS